MVIFGPRGRAEAVGRSQGRENRNTGVGNVKGKREKTRGRIEIRIDPWKCSSGTATNLRLQLRSFVSFSLPSSLLPLFSLLSSLLCLDPSLHPDRTLLAALEREISSYSVRQGSLNVWAFISGEIRDINSGSMATFTATTQIVLTGNEPQEFQEDNG